MLFRSTVSLRLDAQGKTMSHALLTMPITVPAALVAAAERGDAAHRAALGLRGRTAAKPKTAAKRKAKPGRKSARRG